MSGDPLLERLDMPVLGLNVAFHWPLAEAFRGEYDRLRARLIGLDEGVYVYPFEQTHVTVATIISFKRHQRPDADERARILSIVPCLRDRLDEIAAGLTAFTVDVGAPVLVPGAAFLPITNATGEVAAIRQRLRGEPALQAELQIPQAIHSTILRFRRPPSDPGRFAEHFANLATSVRFGTARVQAILITTETRPYMIAGQIVHQIHLKSLHQAEQD